MNKTLFRQKSIERISSPEQLNDYLRVTTPTVWVALAAVILLLAALLVWSSVTSIESFAAGIARAEDGVLTVSFDDQEKAQFTKAGMDVSIGGLKAVIHTIGLDDHGNIIAVAKTTLPNGTYEAKVGYDNTQIIDLLLN